MLTLRPDTLIAFGDSLSDAGTIAGLSSQLLPFTLPFDDRLIDPAYAGVWSNGPVHTQLLPGLLGAEAVVYATGAARALGVQALRDTLGPAALFVRFGLDRDLRDALLAFDLNLGGQVSRFLADAAVYPNGPEPSLRLRDDVAGVIFVGLNDIGELARGFEADDPDDVAAALALPGALAAAVEAQAVRLAEAGSLDALVFYAPPPIRFFPTGTAPAEGVAAMDALVASYAAALTAVAARIETTYGIETDVVDLAPIADQIDADPGSFGFRAKGPYYEGQGTDPDLEGIDLATGLPRLSFPVNPAIEGLSLDEIQFFDEVHWSAALHGTMAAYGAAALTSELRVLGDGRERVTGTDGADLVLAAGGADRVAAGAGRDVVLGGTGADVLSGQTGRDILAGGAGRDRISGGAQDDLLAGGAGVDLLKGGRGDDILADGPGSDAVRGGAGDDTFVWVASGHSRAADSFQGGRGTDVLYLISIETAEIEAEMAGRTPQQIAQGLWSFESLGITARGVETVVGIAALDEVEAPNSGLLDQGQLWGFL